MQVLWQGRLRLAVFHQCCLRHCGGRTSLLQVTVDVDISFEVDAEWFLLPSGFFLSVRCGGFPRGGGKDFSYKGLGHRGRGNTMK